MTAHWDEFGGEFYWAITKAVGLCVAADEVPVWWLWDLKWNFPIYRCSTRNVPDSGRMFLKLTYTDITKNTYIRS